jgi:predicted transglutaminase-like cysteine proteinase
MRTRLNPMLILILVSLLIALPGLAELTISEKVLAKIESQYNKFARQRVENWRDLVANPDNHDLSEKEKLELVNKFFNSNVMFLNDIDLWKQKDYWATPLEMLSIGAGDCEDYSIAKYFTLKELGVDEEKLRITYVKATEIDQAHMVLTYFETRRATPLVLDNLIIDIKPANQRRDLVPVYSFNGTGLWLAKSRGEGQRVGEASKLSLWNDLEKRMQQQALQ